MADKGCLARQKAQNICIYAKNILSLQTFYQ